MTELFRFGQPLALAIALPLLAILIWRVWRLPRVFGRRHRAIQIVMILAGFCAMRGLVAEE